ncbi:bifunctional oligoribonuclease/PAP phosphatase NrnA [Mycoplasmatota bacterium WC44]
MENKILDKIKDYSRIIIHTHKRPDGDCYGSAFGLKSIIKNSFPDKEVYVMGEYIDYVSFVGEVDNIEDELYKDALSIVVDTASQSRVADQRFIDSDYVIKIDHHIPVDDYGDINFVLTDRPACSQIILEFYLKFKDNLKICDLGIRALLTGIITDTGRFKYRSVTPDTFKVTGSLLELGITLDEVYKHLDVKSEEYLRLKGYVLMNYEKTINGVAFVKLTQSIINDYNISMEEATSLVNELGVLKECPVWILFAEYPDNSIRGRIRSKGPSIDLLANEYHGGGHSRACGVTLTDWEEANNLLGDTDKLVLNYKKSQK